MTSVVQVRPWSGAPSFDPSGFGVTVETASSEADALDALAAGDVDCVVCAVDPDTGAGLNAIRAVRERDPTVPVVAYSAASDGAIATEATRAGATEYVSAARLGDADAALRDRVRDLAETGTPLGPVVEGSPDPTLLLAGDYTVRYRNHAAASAFAGSLVGESFADALHPSDVESFRGVTDGGGAATVRVRAAGGDWTDVALSVADRRTDARVRGFVVTGRDSAPETANEVDADLVSQAAHDLRTPLATAKTYLDLARENPERLDDVAMAHDRLEDLVSDVRTLATSARGVEEPEPVDLAAVARDAWETAGDADAELRVDDDLGEVSGAPKALRRLFENLFRNACEHGASAVAVESTADGFAVSDDGEGVPEGNRESVFEQGFTTRETGTGYGLAIVQSIAGAHGFGVTVEDAASGGARFVFTR